MSPRAELWRDLGTIAPLHLAGSWDNVGPLIDPPKRSDCAERLFLTIDLTERVFEEAIRWGATVIIAYHPPIFGGLKRLDLSDHLGRVILRAIQAGVAIYSPHSALDAVDGGLCDWLSIPFACLSSGGKLNADEALSLIEEGTPLSGLSEIQPLDPSPLSPKEGAGRLITLSAPQPLESILSALKAHLEIDYFRVACAERIRDGIDQIKTIALCPGAGGSLFAGRTEPDLFFTGEMSHHDILHRVREGAAVILTEHTRCERGFLPVWAARLSSKFSIDVQCSQLDDDPLTLWPPRPLSI